MLCKIIINNKNLSNVKCWRKICLPGKCIWGTHFSRTFCPAQQDILSTPGSDVPCKISHCVISTSPDAVMEFIDLTFTMLTNLTSSKTENDKIAWYFFYIHMQSRYCMHQPESENKVTL